MIIRDGFHRPFATFCQTFKIISWSKAASLAARDQEGTDGPDLSFV